MSELQDKTTFTLAEAAQLLSCHRETLRRSIHEGTLQAAKLGREFRISKLDLEAFWASRGGGNLFVPAEGQAEPVKPEPKEPKKALKEDKGPRQLSFLSAKDEKD